MKLFELLSVAVAVGAMHTSFAQNNKNSNTSFPDYEVPYEIKEGVKISTKNNTPLVFAGIKDAVTGATPEEMAKNWIVRHKDELKLQNPEDLKAYFQHDGAAGTTVRFRQYHQGIPVFQSEVVVHISPRNEVTYVGNTFDPSVAGITTTPTISVSDAYTAAKNAIKATGDMHFSSDELMIYNREVSALTYKIILEPEAPLGSWEIIVNAQSGEIIRFGNKACHIKGHGHEVEETEEAMPLPLPVPVNGTGNVFDPDPLSVALAQYGAPYNDAGDGTNASFDATMSNVTLLDIDFDGTNYNLVGPYAEVSDHENPFKGTFSQTSSAFDFNRSDDAFEAVNCYFHIDQSMRYINLTLGVSCMPFQYPGGVQYDPSGWNGADNSSYSGGSGRLSFGEGGVDDAEDADVVLHELGHGIHDWLTGGNLSQVDGLSEGSGDYWAVSYSRSKNQWTSADAEYNWVFSWDGHNQYWNGRITDYTAQYPGGLTGAIHTDGQIWATCLMRIYEILGRTKVDAAFLEGLAMTGGNTSQEDAAIAVRQAAIDLGYSCADVDVFTVEFTATGYNMPALTPPSGNYTATLCSGESVVINGTTYDQMNPTGTEVIPGATSACDSTVTINLTFVAAPGSSITNTICSYESISVNGTTYDANNPTGTEVFAGAGSNGCDSTVSINLTVIPEIVTNINNTLCYGDSMVVNGTTYSEANPTGSEILTAQSGCDSTVNISLSFSSSLSSTVSGPICQGESMVINGTTYDYSNPTGTEVFPNVGQNGCDSTVTIDLTPVLPSTSSITDQLCPGESITVNGNVYDENTPSGTETLPNAVGCDSTITVSLTFDAPIDATVTDNSPSLSANQTGATYQWIDCDNGNAPIAGQTGQSFTATVNGNYAVEVTVGNCSETSACVTVDNVGLDALELSSVTVYPNPSEGIFTVDFGSLSSVATYSVVSVDGKVVRDVAQTQLSTTIVDLRTESKGVYFLNIAQDGKTRVFKLVVK